MLERRNPLPVGRYWLDVFGPNIATFTAWTRANPTVKVVSSEFFSEVTGLVGQEFDVGPFNLPDAPQTAVPTEPTTVAPKRQWTLFDVDAPTAFDSITFGAPTVVKQSASVSTSGRAIDTGVRFSGDTVDRGTDSGLLDELARGLNLSPELAALLPLVALGIAALVVTSVINNRK
jgi:hypothetical protein